MCSIPVNVEADGPVNIVRYVSKDKLRSPPLLDLGWRIFKNACVNLVKAKCDTGCMNGGTCVGSNQCRCTPGYWGSYCQHGG